MGGEFSFRAVLTTISGASPCVLSPGTTVLNQAMLSLAEISDRLEIQQLLVDYSTAIDQRRFDDVDNVFTPGAYIEV
jgi:SnoaL-like protein